MFLLSGLHPEVVFLFDIMPLVLVGVVHIFIDMAFPFLFKDFLRVESLLLCYVFKDVLLDTVQVMSGEAIIFILLDILEAGHGVEDPLPEIGDLGVHAGIVGQSAATAPRDNPAEDLLVRTTSGEVARQWSPGITLSDWRQLTF